MTTDLTVRAALLDDAPGIARVHIQAWRECYAHLLPAATLAGLEQGPREAQMAQDHCRRHLGYLGGLRGTGHRRLGERRGRPR